MYSFLQEEDVLEYLFNTSLSCVDTKIAYSLEQRGFYKRASEKYIKLLNCEINKSEFYFDNLFVKENEFRKIHLIK